MMSSRATARCGGLGAALLAGCVAGCLNVDRHALQTPDTAVATVAEVTTADPDTPDTNDTGSVDTPEVVTDDTTVVAVDSVTALDTPDVPFTDAEVIGFEVEPADTQPPDTVEVTACDTLDHCLIGGVCYDAGAPNPDGAAGRSCNPGCSGTTWAPDCALPCLPGGYCDGGHCLAEPTQPYACFVPDEDRCFGPTEQAEGVDWRDQPDNSPPWPTLDRNTAYKASLNPLGPNPDGVGNDVDWVRWSVTSGVSAVASALDPVASARVANHTGVPIELCVLVTCGLNPDDPPAAVTCSKGADPYPNEDATRRGCCTKMSPDESLATPIVWARPVCTAGVTQHMGFARISTRSRDGGTCATYELSVDLDLADLPAP